MKNLIWNVFYNFGYDISRARKSRFTISGLTYEVDPCSVGRTPQGEMTAEAAITMIKERQLRDLKVLDICCGVGIVGMTIFSRLGKELTVKQVALADINIFNLNSLRRTLAVNHLDHLLGDRIACYLSEGLSHIPRGERFDLIVSNPPHYFVPDRTKEGLSPGRLGTYDAGWSFHKSFYEECHEYLTDKGEVWFLENSAGASEEVLLPFIEANASLRYEKQIREPLDPGFFWMITRRAQG
jgi:methylase of polypeptide subunit release factors